VKQAVHTVAPAVAKGCGEDSQIDNEGDPVWNSIPSTYFNRP